MTEDELVAQVRAAFDRLDPVPDEVIASGRAALRSRLRGAALIDLTCERVGAEGVRGAGPTRLIFTGAGVKVEIEIGGGGIAGRLSPPVPARVRMRHPDPVAEPPTTSADAAGQFAFPYVRAGLMSLVLDLPDGTSVVTSWARV
ncbi:hypothetical protein [Spirillospora sp. CA-294931]|uniref:hypothetical protein n=1 Tax=Spirillospora sp. CA-294931 TaxID=3240042 RepID=UPI003D8CEAF6